jgi:GET complex subunit GET2
MADTAPPESSDGPPGETPNQKRARLRREKLQKRTAEQGEDRLARIKALNGGVAPPEEVLGGPGSQPQVASVADDPDEVDISQNPSGYGTPSKQDGSADPDPLRAAMLQMRQQEAKKQQQDEEEDPMVKMMQQMAGLMGGNPNDPNAAPPEIPPALKALLGAGGPATKEEAPPATGSTYMWRIVHAIFAFFLAGYIAITSTFNGSKLSRSETVYTKESGYGLGQRLFLIFCTAELLLQSSRYFVEKGQLQGNGMIAKVANSGLVPEPYAGYVRMVGRYIGIVQTILADALMIVFVFGMLAWWQGMAAV